MIGRPSRSLTPLLLLLAAACTCAAEVPDDYQLTLSPGWGGYLKRGASVELTVGVLARLGGEGRLIVQSSLTRINSDLRFLPGVPATVRLPLAHDSVEPVVVELYIGNELAIRKELDLQLLPASADIVAVVSGQTPPSWPPEIPERGNTTVIPVEVTELPRQGRNYDMLSALLLPGSALARLDRPQQQALTEFIGGCGRLYLTGLSTTQESALRNASGCHGRNLIVTRYDETLISRPVSFNQLPGAATLRLLLPGGSGGVLRSLVVFLGAYVLLLMLVARSAKSTLPLLVLPPLATALAVLGWSLGQPVSRVSSWAEMDSGDQFARFAGILEVVGMSRGLSRISLPPRLGLPLPVRTEHPAEYDFSTAGADFNLHLDTRFLSHHEFIFTGVALGPPVEVVSHGGEVQVFNRGDSASRSGLLAWQGHRYSVPVLNPGEEWRQPPFPEPWGDTAQEQLLRQRATRGGSWLLLPYHNSTLESVATEAETGGWLLIRGGGDA